VVRTIHGLRPSSGEVLVPDASAPPIDPAQTLPWHRVPKTAGESFTVPERIGHYQVLGRLGEGGMGVVLKAKHATLDRLVALKVMKPSLAKDPAYVERFMREARIAASLEHPNLVTVYDAAYEDGFLYMALRHVDGGDLGEALQRDGALDQARAITVFTGCAQALAVIAAKGLVHRDIKPGNILLDRDGTPRLADFGLARAQAGGAADTAAAGTPAFMSPEQLDGTGDLDVRSDIYSLGVTMFVALTCQQPFQGADVVATIANVLKAEAPDARACNPAVSQAMAQLVAKAMRKDRTRRHQSAAEFLDQLQGVQDESRNEISASGVTWFGKLFGPKPGKG
jgi:serine/threonine protein kinase